MIIRWFGNEWSQVCVNRNLAIFNRTCRSYSSKGRLGLIFKSFEHSKKVCWPTGQEYIPAKLFQLIKIFISITSNFQMNADLPKGAFGQRKQSLDIFIIFLLFNLHPRSKNLHRKCWSKFLNGITTSVFTKNYKTFRVRDTEICLLQILSNFKCQEGFEI